MCEQQTYAEPVLRLLIGALLFNRPTSTDEFTSAAASFDELLGTLDERLAPTGWLAGERLTAADVNLYPLLNSVIVASSTERSKDGGLRPSAVDSFGNVMAWMERLKPFAAAE